MYSSPVTEFKKEDGGWRVLVHLSKDEVLDGGLIIALPSRLQKKEVREDEKEGLQLNS